MDPSRSATLGEAAARLPDIAAMGFDVLYLPPIHPIGLTDRKGRHGRRPARAEDPGSPWAVGSAGGGHFDIEPSLGTLEDFDRFVARAREVGLEIALDLAVHCSPDHPYVREHPEWFPRHADGSLRHAENPPNPRTHLCCHVWLVLPGEGGVAPQSFGPTKLLRRALPSPSSPVPAIVNTSEFWGLSSTRTFGRWCSTARTGGASTTRSAGSSSSGSATASRSSVPTTRTPSRSPFGSGSSRTFARTTPTWCSCPEAFTRPKIMRHLAKLGFSQSYTYFMWRTTKRELVSYFEELTRPDRARVLQAEPLRQHARCPPGRSADRRTRSLRGPPDPCRDTGGCLRSAQRIRALRPRGRSRHRGLSAFGEIRISGSETGTVRATSSGWWPRSTRFAGRIRPCSGTGTCGFSTPTTTTSCATASARRTGPTLSSSRSPWTRRTPTQKPSSSRSSKWAALSGGVRACDLLGDTDTVSSDRRLAIALGPGSHVARIWHVVPAGGRLDRSGRKVLQ